MGMGIVAMHYTGMAALKVEPAIVWDMFWVAISVIIALTASFAALWLTFRLRHEAAQVALMRFGAAIDGDRHCRYALQRHDGRAIPKPGANESPWR
jgi:NO-binding membrane sensor protein with MHYT domain